VEAKSGGCWLRSMPGPCADREFCTKSCESAIKQVSICFLIQLGWLGSGSGGWQSSVGEHETPKDTL
jgi:hypothetical protein